MTRSDIAVFCPICVVASLLRFAHNDGIRNDEKKPAEAGF
jgi:hypothetical protein